MDSLDDSLVVDLLETANSVVAASADMAHAFTSILRRKSARHRLDLIESLAPGMVRDTSAIMAMFGLFTEVFTAVHEHVAAEDHAVFEHVARRIPAWRAAIRSLEESLAGVADDVADNKARDAISRMTMVHATYMSMFEELDASLNAVCECFAHKDFDALRLEDFDLGDEDEYDMADGFIVADDDGLVEPAPGA